MQLQYSHVNVFSQRPYGGNGLPVFLDAPELSTEQMLLITQELRHFEAIFLKRTSHPRTVCARVFDLLQELPFAGHPLIGAAAVLHQTSTAEQRCDWRIELTSRAVAITTERTPSGYFGMLDQGTPDFLGRVARADWIARAFGIEAMDLHPELPLEVISTGLRYLIVPVAPGVLHRAHIARDITEGLRAVGAQYAVLFDEAALEVRHWNNDGIVEDVATGSAAGTIGAYRLRHRLTQGGEIFVLNQGQYAGRPSTLRIQPEGSSEEVSTVKVGGDVSFVGRGTLEVLP